MTEQLNAEIDAISVRIKGWAHQCEHTEATVKLVADANLMRSLLIGVRTVCEELARIEDRLGRIHGGMG